MNLILKKIISSLLLIAFLIAPGNLGISEAKKTESNVSPTYIIEENILGENKPSEFLSFFYPVKRIIPIVHNRTKTEIISVLEGLPHSGFESKKTKYKETPKFTAPYFAGSLDTADIADAENAMKAVRFLAGVPYENTKFTDELNNIAQHGSVLLAASNQFSHYPTKPADMDDVFFELGYKGCNEANIFAGITSISYGVLGWVYDDGANNIAKVGHRRWIFNPGNQSFGIGYAQYSKSTYGGNRANMHCFDGYGPWECESDSYIAWPASGYFPIQYFAANEYINSTIDSPWSINLGSPYQSPSRENVEVKLTRHRDQKVWIFNNDTPNLGVEGLSDEKLHFSVDNDGYGMTKAIVFRPDLKSLGRIIDGDIFTIEITGIKDTSGAPTSLVYDINFFDLAAAQSTPEEISVTGVSLDMGAVTLTAGKKITLYATVTPTNATNKNVMWSSSNTNVATVSDGVITAKAEGTAIITVRTLDGSKTASCIVTVNKKIPSVVPGSAGDNNSDGEIDAKDSVLLAQFLANWEVEIHKIAADCNVDGAINAKDAVLLSQYLANWEVTLG